MIQVHACLYKFIFEYTFVCMNICVYVYMSMRVCMYTRITVAEDIKVLWYDPGDYVFIHVYVCICLYAYGGMCRYLLMHTCTHVYTCMHVYMYMYIIVAEANSFIFIFILLIYRNANRLVTTKRISNYGIGSILF
jgi:hypothetical protein